MQLVLFVAVVALTIWTAWDYGGGYRNTRALVLWCLLGLSPLAIIAAVLRGSQASRPPLLCWFALAVWLVGMAQCIPLPDSWTRVVSPASYEAYRQWLPESVRREALSLHLPAVRRIASDSIPISVSPTHTRIALSIPILFAAVCWLGSLCFSDRRLIVAFLASTAVAGATFSFLGLADTIRLQRDREVELRQRLIISPVGADDPFGPFVNNNNGANYVNLSIGCALGMLLGMAGGRWSRLASAAKRNVMSDREQSADGETPTRSTPVAKLLTHWQFVIWTLLTIVMATGVLASGSRGAFLGMSAASLVTVLCTTEKKVRWVASGVVIVTTLFALTLLSWLNMDEHTSARLRTLYDGFALNDPRLTHWHDATTAALHAMPGGIGFGAYRYGYLPYQQTGGGGWFINADGMPIEWWVEGGVWLPLIAMAGILVYLFEVRQLARLRPRLPRGTAKVARMVIITGIFVLVAMVTSQSFDFGILLFPLLMTVALLCGALTSLARAARTIAVEGEDANSDHPERDDHGSDVGNRHEPESNLWRLGTSVLAVITLLAGLMLAALDMQAGSVVQRIERYHDEIKSIPVANRESLDEQIHEVRGWLARRQGDAELHRLLALLLLDEQHRLGAKALVDRERVDAKTAATWTAPRNLRRASFGSGTDPQIDLETLLLPGQDATQWRLARQHMLAATTLCPLDDTARLTLANLDFVGEGSDGATELLQGTAELRQRDRRVLRYLESLAGQRSDELALRRIQQLRRRLHSEQANGR